MRRAFLTSIVGCLLLLGASLHGEDYVLDRFGEFLEALRVQVDIPGMAAAVVGTDDIIWERAFGRQDLESTIYTRTDTPFHIDGLTQIFTATMALSCVEEGRLSLDDRVGQFISDSPDAGATIGQLLSHTSESPSGLVFNYRPERLEPLSKIVRECAKGSYRKTLSNLFDGNGMLADSVPGPDAPRIVPPAEGVPTAAQAERYARTLTRLATPYLVDSSGRASKSQYPATTLTTYTGAISSVRDLARFDVGLKKGYLLHQETLGLAWRPPPNGGRELPHGYGWFVQNYNGAPVIWQFGVGENASSSMIIMLPARGVTLILLANSSKLARPFPLAAGDLTVSPFAKAFLGAFSR